MAGLLKRLLIEQTKSRPRKSNDNGLVESKNGAVIRKHMGYGYIAAAHAEDIDQFYQRALQSVSELPSAVRTARTDRGRRGKEKYVYRRYATPWETLRQLVRAWPEPRAISERNSASRAWTGLRKRHSDTESARQMQEAKRKLFLGFSQERESA